MNRVNIMNLTTLKYFISVASLGSITEAAQEAYVSQSAVSKTIKQLEEEIGVKLFDREGRTTCRRVRRETIGSDQYKWRIG